MTRSWDINRLDDCGEIKSPSDFRRLGLCDGWNSVLHKLDFRDAQQGSYLNKTRLANAVYLQDALHRSAITLSDLEQRFAALYPVVHNFGWLRLARRGVEVCATSTNGDMVRSCGQLYTVARWYEPDGRVERRIPAEKLITAKSRGSDQRRQCPSTSDFNFFNCHWSFVLQAGIVLAGIATDFDGGEKFGVKVFGRKAPVGMIVFLNQIDEIIGADFFHGACHPSLSIVV